MSREKKKPKRFAIVAKMTDEELAATQRLAKKLGINIVQVWRQK